MLFNKLPFDSYMQILSSTLQNNIDSFKKVIGIDVEVDNFEKLCVIFLLGFLPDFDVRRIKSKVSQIFFDKITDTFRDIGEDNISKIRVVQSDEVKKVANEILQKSTEDKQIFVLDCFRKSFSYTYELNVTQNGDELILELSNIKKIRVEKSKDFDGKGAITLEVPDVTFSQIAGHKKAKDNLGQIIKLLKNPAKLKEYKVDIPKGMLLYGVPGTGKTMLAKAFANEADLPFISTTGTEILDIEFMKKIFKRAREYAPSIIFIDEIDAIGKRDGGRIDIIINQLLSELNGFEDGDDNLFVIAATNFKQKIDSAILRSGRIDQHIEIGYLDKEARAYFIDKILKNIKHTKIDKDKMITYTSQMSGADLEKVKRESSLFMIKQNIKNLTEEILLEQINIVKYGQKLKGNSLKNLVASTAYHEAGHAVMSAILIPDTSIEQITITPRNNALGFVSYNNEDNYKNMTKKYIQDKICVLLAGRIAQMREFKEEGFDSGASSDLAQATHLANMAISRLGMGEAIGYVSSEKLKENESHSLMNEINKEIKEWIEKSRKETETLVEKHWNKIEKVAKILIEKESIEEKELYDVIGNK